ncbi:BZ3500_MvSof-1268-A1-R1_Chr11-1g03290 [Microbotryum saponariae]|uniref:BZ3500_MvSof-1268-A1-R1_Chr11-1g03290 protein n=1 Tax=Microbotryum saponariae TaxID=289078 RepID=A0A2X0LDC2_9BASI|nr:BZ3501_MvSof-1269-A2-R1_Chr11g02865 [Microbotryum saponariae]SDA03895.1 BZ3500_MvSof-1268-A1-R1_Chr11-1g03290 [Microbotryum saponariae]
MVSAVPDATLSSPHHHLLLRKGECAGARIALKPLKPHVSIRDYLGPQTAVCTHCKARHWECERSKSTGHFSTCCSQDKVRLPSPPQPDPEYRQLLEGSDSEAEASRENARSYHNALLRPTLDGADSRIQRSTLTNLESMLRTGNRFVREFAPAKARAGWDTAKETVLRLCLPPGRDRRTHNRPTSSTEMAMLICDSDTGDRGPQGLILQVHGDRCPDLVGPTKSLARSIQEDSFHLNIPLRGFHQAASPIVRNREQIDNAVQLREVLAGLGLDDEGEEEDEDGDDEDEDGEGRGRRRMVMVTRVKTKGTRWINPSLAFPALHPAFLPRVRDRRILPNSPAETDRRNHIRFHQESLRLTTAQGITDAVANGLTPDQTGRSVILGSTVKTIPREITQRYQDATACVVEHGNSLLFITVTCKPGWPDIKAALGPNDKACGRLDLIARAFEAKLNRLCHDDLATSIGQAVSAMNGEHFLCSTSIVVLYLC